MHRAELDDLLDDSEVEYQALQGVEKALYHGEEWFFDGLRAVYLEPGDVVIGYGIVWSRHPSDVDVLDGDSVSCELAPEWWASWSDVVRALDEREDILRYER